MKKEIVIKIETKFKKNDVVVQMPKIFKDINCDFKDFTMSFTHLENELKISITSQILKDENIIKIFWDFYTYLKILLGYYPKISECSFMDGKELKKIAEKYKTKERFIRNSEQFIQSLDERNFKSSFKKFRIIYDKAELPMSMLDISTMENNAYVDLAIVNLLQALDGFYEIRREKYDREIIMKRLYSFKSFLTKSNLKKIKLAEYKKITKEIKNIEKIFFKDKLEYLITKTKFDIFDYEKNLDKKNAYSFEKVLSKFVNTRNKFSHCINKKSTLNGSESSAYINKLVLLYRNLLFEEIGLSRFIVEKSFLENLKGWDSYICDTLKKEDSYV